MWFKKNFIGLSLFFLAYDNFFQCLIFRKKNILNYLSYKITRLKNNVIDKKSIKRERHKLDLIELI